MHYQLVLVAYSYEVPKKLQVEEGISKAPNIHRPRPNFASRPTAELGRGLARLPWEGPRFGGAEQLT